MSLVGFRMAISLTPREGGAEVVYSDNETEVDLLGFEDQVDDLCDVVTDAQMLPVTVGVLGDWGSGKTSLMKMAERRLRADGVIVVPFSPWRIESYDDVKSALLDTVIEEVAGGVAAAGDESIAAKALASVNRLRKRVRWLRVAGLAAKHVITLTAPSLDELDGLLNDDTPVAGAPGTERLARDFHDEFCGLVEDLEQQVVVLIDDLDRCLPEQVLDVLHAIRLFLAVPGTAFVLAADERVVRDAVRIRYPQATAGETDLPQEYLEKILQVPLRIPPLGSAEVESYLNLLVAQQHLAAADFELLQSKAADLRVTGVGTVSMNLGIAREYVSAGLPAGAEADFELISRIAKLLATGLKGNPRQVKRFLNGLELRRRAVRRRQLEDSIDDAVLAKLAVLEYAQLRRFRTLHEWQAAADGRPPQLAFAESILRGDDAGAGPLSAKDTSTATKPDPAVSEWTEGPWLRQWLAIDPPLTGVDLGPYFVLARDALHGTAIQARRLPQRLQGLLDRLASSSREQRDAAVTTATALDSGDLGVLVDAAIERLPLEAESMDLGLALVTLAEQQPRHVGSVLKAVAELPYGAVALGAPLQIVNRLRAVAPDDVARLLNGWEVQDAEPRLSRSAGQARRMMAGGN